MVRKTLVGAVLLSLSALGCGAGEPEPDVKLHLQLEGAAPSATLYDVLVFGQAVTCAAITANPSAFEGEATTLCTSANADSSTTCHISHDQLPASGQGLITGISVGTRTVFVNALDATASVGTGCATATVKAGTATAVNITVN
jgi:hypothetical protein